MRNWGVGPSWWLGEEDRLHFGFDLWPMMHGIAVGEADRIARSATDEAASATTAGEWTRQPGRSAEQPTISPIGVPTLEGEEPEPTRVGEPFVATAFASEQASVEKPQHNGNGERMASSTYTASSAVDALLSGQRWSDGAITYSTPDARADYQAGYNSDQNGDGRSAQDEGFSHLSIQQHIAAHFALNPAILTQPAGAAGFSVGGFTNLGVSFAGSGSGLGTIRLANTLDAATAYAFHPGGSIYGGDAWFGSPSRDPVAGNYSWHTVLHELGHSLGLKHGHEDDTAYGGSGALPAHLDSLEYTVMTYRTYVGDNGSGYNYEAWGAPQTYMMLDIAALQHLYGADFSTNSGNTVYTWNPGSGESYVNGLLAIDPGGNKVFSTVWDGGGTDTYDLSNYSTNLTLDLAPGAHSTFSAAQLAYLGGGPNGGYARGNVFNALQHNGDARSLIEHANGGTGNDVISGNSANNALRGNGGDDRLAGGRGWDTLDGGAGADTGVFAGLFGARHDLISHNGSVFALDGRSRTYDTVANVEMFTDGIATIGSGRIEVLDAWSYAASYDDLALAFRTDANAAAMHYISSGFFDGRETSFDALQYLANYQDLRTALGSDTAAASAHFLTYGVGEHRLAEDPLDYIASYAGLIGAFDGLGLGETRAAGISHYQNTGWNQGLRSGIAFDAEQYLANFADLRSAFGANDDLAAWHFINSGHGEGRLWEDPLDYVASFGDLISAFGGGNAGTIVSNALLHFASTGLSEGRRAGIDFDADQYLANYGDLRSVFADGTGGYDEDAATLHFIRAGYAEGRSDDVLIV